MFEKFLPDLYYDSIQDIEIDKLKTENIKGLILDIDNTLVPQFTPLPDENCLQWIDRARAEGLKLCIVSNASKKRVSNFNEIISLHTIHRAGKPGIDSFRKAAGLMGLQPEETAVVGDQLFTDMLGGKRAGMLTILVKPISKKEIWWVRLKRIPEKLVLKHFKQNKF